MSTYSPITTDIAQAVDIIRQGRVVAFPTGTSYGLAADALQGHALQRVRNMKHRPIEKALTVFMAPELYDTYLKLTSEEQDFLQSHEGQAITLLVTPSPTLKHLSQDGRLGLRFIDHPVMAQFAKAAQVPMTATSANVSDTPACLDPDCIIKNFPGLLSDELLSWYEPDQIQGATHSTYDLSLGCILDGSTLPPSQPSTIIKVENSTPHIIRPGKVKF